MQKYKILVAIGVAASILLLIAFSTSNQKSRSPLFVKPASLNFGAVPANPKFAWSVPVQNRSKERIVLDAIKTSCSCTVIGSQKIDLEPGQTRTIDLTLDLTGKTTQGRSPRPFGVTIIAESSASHLSYQWTLEGKVLDVIQLSSRRIDLGELIRGRPSVMGTRIEVSTTSPLNRVDAQESPGIRVNKLATSTPERIGFEILADPQEKLGRRAFPITFRAVTDEGHESFLEAVAYCSVVDEIGIQPDTTFLGVIKVNNQLKVRRKLFARSGDRIEVQGISSHDVSEVDVDARLESNDKLVLTLTPNRVGHHVFEIDVKWRLLTDNTDFSPPTNQSQLRLSCIGFE